MKKSAVRGILCIVITAVMYLLVAFLIPFVHTAAFWVSFVFGLAAIAVAAGSVYYALIKVPDAKSRFYGFPIARIGVVYGVVQIAAAIAVMALAKWIDGWIPGVIFAVALGVTALGLIGVDTVVEEIKEQEKVQKADVTFMHMLQSKVNQMVSLCDVAELAAFAEELRYADPVSSPALEAAQADLDALVDELQQAVVEEDRDAVRILSVKANAALGERNRLCKLTKKN